MDYLRKKLLEVKPKLEKVSQKASKAVDELKPKIKTLAATTSHAVKDYFNLEEGAIHSLHEQDLMQITPRIYTMDFPSEKKIKSLAEALNSKFGSNYFIWNVSEHTYETTPFKNQVADMCITGYPCLPLEITISVCKSIIAWLMSNKKNVAVVHCQHTRGRSALVIICLLCLLKVFPHPSEALLHFCKMTGLNENKLFFPSQRLYLKYFSNIYIDHIKPNMKKVKIEKVVLSETPQLKRGVKSGKKSAGVKSLKPYLQMFKNSKIIFNTLNDNKEPDEFFPEMAVWFDSHIETYGDVLIRCKHYASNDERVSMFRFMVNTAFFFDGVVRLYKRDIDFPLDATASDKFYIDIFFTVTEENVGNEMSEEWERMIQQIEELKTSKPENNKLPVEERGIEGKGPNHNFSINDELSPGEIGEREEEEEKDQVETDPAVLNKILNKIKVDDDEGLEQEVDDYFNKLEEK